MKKLSVIILSFILSMSLCLPVLALEIDLIEDEKKEEIKDEYKEDMKEKDEKDNDNDVFVKAALVSPIGASTIRFYNDLFGTSYYYSVINNYINGGTPQIGDKYVIFTGSNSLPSDTYLFPQIGYFIRGEEERNGVYLKQSNQPYGGVVSSSRCFIDEFMSDSFTPKAYMYCVNEYYDNQEPTPEPTPTPGEPTVSDNSVSWNSVSVNLISIENEIRGLRKDVQNLSNATFSVSISNINVSDNQVSNLSDDIIHKPLKEYSTSESMSLIGLMLAFTGLMVYVVHKSIYRWKR